MILQNLDVSQIVSMDMLHVLLGRELELKRALIPTSFNLSCFTGIIGYVLFLAPLRFDRFFFLLIVAEWFCPVFG